MRTSNPTLREDTFNLTAVDGESTMSLNGTVAKTFVLAILVFVTAAIAWSSFPPVSMPTIESYRDIKLPVGALPWILVSMIGGLVAAIGACVAPRWSWFFAPLYALLEGIFLGVISACFEGAFPGVVIEAVSLTIGTLMALLLAYGLGIVKATENFKLGVLAATGGIALVYLATIILGLFGIEMPFVHETGIGGILFSLFVVVIAALNLVLDFDFIEKGCERRAPSYMEWYAAFGLMVTLIWLYLEILKLRAKMRSK